LYDTVDLKSRITCCEEDVAQLYGLTDNLRSNAVNTNWNDVVTKGDIETLESKISELSYEILRTKQANKELALRIEELEIVPQVEENPFYNIIKELYN
jgi:hypothetical protein